MRERKGSEFWNSGLSTNHLAYVSIKLPLIETILNRPNETPSYTRLEFIKRLSVSKNEELGAICYAAYLLLGGSNS